MSRHNISIPDELWAKAQIAAIKAGLERGKSMSASEWLRGLILEKLEEK